MEKEKEGEGEDQWTCGNVEPLVVRFVGRRHELIN